MANTYRKLTTILCADVEDYSRLMGADEEGTHAALMRSRHVIKQQIGAHDGRFINSWGDAFIAEFASAVEALRAAIGIQRDIDRMNAGCPDEMPMRFRIGINLGDVIVDGNDIYGDGVNIASRLQAEAPAGGIVISRTVHDQVHNKLKVEFRYLGALIVKNIALGIHGYSVHSQGEHDMGSAPLNRKGTHPAAKGTGSRVSWARLGWHASGRSVRFALLLVVLNLMTWNGTFWASWPLLVLAAASAFRTVRATRWIDRGTARLGVAAATILAVNILTWQGTLWAAWALFTVATICAVRHWSLREAGRQ
jgi:class 3 adenylate cyclase